MLLIILGIGAFLLIVTSWALIWHLKHERAWTELFFENEDNRRDKL